MTVIPIEHREICWQRRLWNLQTKAEERMSHKLRMGMVGGGPGAFIGPVHKMAAELDGRIELVAGAFSQSPERSRAAGASFGIDPARAYASYAEMFEAERKCEDGIDFVVIATPNNLHL